ncbi:MAG: LuxR C-terminal-related transcriptional regulator [Capsulimonadales bacterium]|nr:LuxR C-terminal-related transcriptional regulator [Capsulimonadales bacterium]
MKDSNSQTADNDQRIAPAEPVVLTTKIAVPSRRTALVDRSRLTERIRFGRQHSRLTVIVAPAGFGKTTLARQWTAAEGDPVAWVSLDGGDNDPIRFLTYVTMAIRRVSPGFGESVLSLLRSPQPPLREVLVTALLNALCEAESPLSLVLDDYHLIGETSVHETVTSLLEHLPPHVHLILSSRVDPPLPIARFRARGELTELRTSDLRCAEPEIRGFLADVMGLSLNDQQVNALAERTEGWMAGLQLAGLSLRNRTDPEAFIAAFTGSNRYIVDYLGEEVLRQQSEEMRHFLYRTAILDRLHGPLCEAVVGDLRPGEGQAILERMEATNLFLVALDDNRRWYRYHHLFGDMLRARLLQESEGEQAELHRRAMEWYENAGLTEPAIVHALSGRRYEDAVRLLESSIRELWFRGEGFTSQRWLAGLPEEYLRRSPALLLFRARYFVVAAQSDLLRTALEEAAQALGPDGGDNPYLRAEYKSLRAFESGFCDRNEETIRLAEEALTDLPEDATMWRSVMQVLLAAVYVEQGEVSRALTLCRTAAEECERIRDPQVASVSRAFVGFLQESQGRLTAAEATYHEALAFARSCRTERLPMSCGAYSGLGSVALQRNDLATSGGYLQTSYELATEIEASDARYRVCYLKILQHLADGDHEAGGHVVENLMAFARKRPLSHARHLSEGIAACFHLGCGHLAEVEKWERQVREANGISDDDTLYAFLARRPGPPSVHSGDIMAMNLIRLREAQGNDAVARRLAERFCAEREAQGRSGSALPIRLLLAVLRHRQGDEAAALTTLLPVLTLSRQEGHLRVFSEVGACLIPILRLATEQGPETEQASRLLRSLHTQPVVSAPPSHPTVSVPDLLTEREIEVLRLVAGGLSNQDIAERLFLSVGTVKRHVHNIFGKLEVDSRLAAISRARENGISV